MHALEIVIQLEGVVIIRVSTRAFEIFVAFVCYGLMV